MLKPWQIRSLIAIPVIALLLFGAAVYSSRSAQSIDCAKQYADQTDRVHECRKEISEENLTYYTLLLSLGTFLLALVAGFQTIIAWRADGTTRIIAQAALDANRPWLNFSVKLIGPLEDHPPSMARIRCELTINNLGKSPATWTNIRALIEQSVDPPSQDIFGFAGPSVFPITPVSFRVFAFIHDTTPTRGLHGRMVQLRIRIRYGAPGMVSDGGTSKNWIFRGPFMGAIDFTRLPIDHREHLHLEIVPESDFAT